MGDGQFGPYRLEKLLGNGGTGQVWRAHDTHTERTVALKILAPALGDDPIYRQRFQREARAAAQLREPHVVPIHTFGEYDGRLFIDMAYLDGTDLGLLLRAGGPLPPSRAVDIISQAAAALDEAHRRGLVHRDVKPANIVIAPNGFTHLIDFGTAQLTGQATLTGTGTVIGTPAYMAPERFSGAAVPASDTYSLACVLYESLTARRPFPAPDPAGQMHAHLTAEPPRMSESDPALPAALDDVLARALAKDPGERHSSTGEFAMAARNALDSAGTAPTTPLVAAGAAPTTPLVGISRGRAAGTGVLAPTVADSDGAQRRTPITAVPAPGFPRRFAALVAVAALLAGAGTGFAVWRAGQDSNSPPSETTPASAPPGVAEPTSAATEAPRVTGNGSTRTVNPAPPPASSETGGPEPTAHTTTQVTIPFPIPNLPTVSGYAGPSTENRPGNSGNGGNGNGGNNGNGQDKHDKPTKPNKPNN
ncbi:serine/threonine-protein kinase [Nocardia yamanashiensis]|uniref:serine/threonine-protein kinase n=1 Tax=Nocardia yamanashiensis TaxID=209247 RepID=UPI0008315530|nr:serine/threonine-protein kinase [Nocardia yamanashiensis]